MNCKKINVIMILTAVLLFAGYIYFATTVPSLGYDLEKKELELSSLHDLESELVVDLAKKQNPEYLLSQSENLDLVEINNISRYIDTRISSISRVDLK